MVLAGMAAGWITLTGWNCRNDRAFTIESPSMAQARSGPLQERWLRIPAPFGRRWRHRIALTQSLGVTRVRAAASPRHEAAGASPPPPNPGAGRPLRSLPERCSECRSAISMTSTIEGTSGRENRATALPAHAPNARRRRSGGGTRPVPPNARRRRSEGGTQPAAPRSTRQVTEGTEAMAERKRSKDGKSETSQYREGGGGGGGAGESGRSGGEPCPRYRHGGCAEAGP